MVNPSNTAAGLVNTTFSPASDLSKNVVKDMFHNWVKLADFTQQPVVQASTQIQ